MRVPYIALCFVRRTLQIAGTVGFAANDNLRPPGGSMIDFSAVHTLQSIKIDINCFTFLCFLWYFEPKLGYDVIYNVSPRPLVEYL